MTTTKKTTEQAPVLNIDQIQAETLHVPIRGTAPLIMHNWSAKAKREILDREQGKKKQKENRVPEADYEAAFYRIDRGDGVARYGFPVVAFKAATVGAARYYGKDVKMTELRMALQFNGIVTPADSQQLFEIVGEPHLREDMVRVGMGKADLRYRPEFTEWTSTLVVTYVKSMLNRTSVLSLIDAGGLGSGVGEWRPEKKGQFGTYEIDQSKEVEVVA